MPRYVPLRTAAATTMYHGTAAGSDGEVLRRILKEGLLPEPPRRVFDMPPEPEESSLRFQEQLATFGGTYASDDLYEALRYADFAHNEFGGDRVIVILRVETRTPRVTIDDELFLNTLMIHASDLGGYALSAQEVYESVVGGSIDLDPFIETKLAEIIEQNRLGVDVSDLLRYRDAFAHLFTLAFEYRAATDFRNKAWSGREPQQILAEFKDAANRLYVKIHDLTRPVEGEPLSVRSLDPISYRGANRIVGIVGFDRRKGPEVVGRVYYDADAAAVTEARRKISSLYGRFGPVTWLDRHGNEISSTRGRRRAVFEYRDTVDDIVAAAFSEIEYRIEQDLVDYVSERWGEMTEALVVSIRIEASRFCTCSRCLNATIQDVADIDVYEIDVLDDWDDQKPELYRDLAYAAARFVARYDKARLDLIEAVRNGTVSLPADADPDELDALLATVEAALYFVDPRRDVFYDHAFTDEFEEMFGFDPDDLPIRIVESKRAEADFLNRASNLVYSIMDRLAEETILEAARELAQENEEQC